MSDKTNYVVDKNDPAAYQTIQEAVDAAVANGGGTILLRADTYTESIDMRGPGVKIIGEDADRTLITGCDIKHAVITPDGLEGRDAAA